MTREEAIKTLNGEAWTFGSKEYQEAFNMAIKALEQEPCEDAVSRQEVDQHIYDYAESNRLSYANMKNYILDVPPVTPARKHGEWEEESFDLGVNLPMRTAYQCSECGNCFDSEFNFCPYCGSDMRGGEE